MPMRLFMVEGCEGVITGRLPTRAGLFREYWWARSHNDAAERAFEHADEIGLALKRVAVSSMVQPEAPQRKGGLVYPCNDTRSFKRIGRRGAVREADKEMHFDVKHDL